ncbi:MAG: repeat-associated core domain protein [Verrucomicrobia bacterium]|nr:repeat-associated core domain protein [Verrucomicrobiota bacterium]
MKSSSPVSNHVSRFIRRVWFALVIGGAAHSASADVVTDWNATLEAALRNPTASPFVEAHAAAIVHVAIYDAVNGLVKNYQPLRVAAPAPAGAMPEAAAIQAAYTTLASLFPAKRAAFDTQLAASLAKISGNPADAPAIALGRTWGESVAQEILTWRANDGFSSTPTYTGSSAPGQWRHTPNAAAPAAGLNMTVTAPFALSNPSAFDPGPPYGQSDRNAAMATAAYAADVNELKVHGGAVSAVRTQAQADLALLINIADFADTFALVRRSVPPTARLVDNARLFALMGIAANDAAIVTFQVKYKYGMWRPIQAINFADEDGNAATSPDSSWTSLAPTPSHPEYVAAHVAIDSAILGVAAAILGEATPFTFSTTNAGAPAITPTFANFRAYSDAIIEGRVNAGFHFRTSCTVGQTMGYAIADQLMHSVLLPLANSGVVGASARGTVGTGNDTLILGFVIGAGTRQVLVRGVGPALVQFGLSNALSDPKVALYDNTGRLIAENDNWSTSATTVTALTEAWGKTGAFPLSAGSKDAALLATLPPGAYTAHVTGVAGSIGPALLEVYQLP